MARIPPIPALSSKTPPDIRRAIEALKTSLTGIVSIFGDDLSQKIIQDLINNPALVPIPPGLIYPTPMAVTGLLVVGAFNTIIISWDLNTNTGVAYTEIFRSTTDDLGAAVCVGTSSGEVFSDSPPDSDLSITYYYWVRYVNFNGVPGAFNAVAGTPGSTADDPAYMIALLSGEIRESELYEGLNTRIDGIELNAAAIETKAYTTDLEAVYEVKLQVNGRVTGFGLVGTATSTEFGILADRFWVADPSSPGTAQEFPFIIDSGKVYINTLLVANATIKNAMIETLAADKLYATTGTIADAIIGTAHIANAMIGQYIQSYSFSAGTAGWRINKDGTAEFHNLLIYDSGGNIILASGSGVAWGAIAGSGKPDDYADVTANNAQGANWLTDLVIYSGNKITDVNIGTYMGAAAIKEAYIGNLAVTTAKIQTANVTTLKVAGNAITVPVSSTSTTLVNVTTLVTLLSVTLDSEGEDVLLIASLRLSNPYSEDVWSLEARMYQGTTLKTSGWTVTLLSDSDGVLSFTYLITTPGSGSNTFYLKATSGGLDVDQSTFTAIGCKR